MSETTPLPAALDMRGRRVLVTGAASYLSGAIVDVNGGAFVG